MSKIELYMRPLVIFEPTNKEHRQLYFNFLQTGSWKDCPYRFAIPDDHGNLMGMIQIKMLRYYGEKEFKTVAEKPQVLVRQKRKKTVDKQTV